MSTAMFNSGAGTMFNSQASVMSVRGIPSLPEKDAEEPEQTRTPDEKKQATQATPVGTPPMSSSRATAIARASARQQTNARDDADGLWPPNGVAKADRCRANVLWMLLLCGAIAYIVGLYVNAHDRRRNPPIKIEQKVEPYSFPDVIFCPAAGNGCDSSDPEECAQGMQVFVPALSGFVEDAADFAETVAAASPAPTPSSSAEISALAPLSESQLPLDTTVHSWCPVIPFSALTIDLGGVDSGDVRSLHASVYVLWPDEVASNPVSSSRQLINTFFLDKDAETEDAVLSRLSYDRVGINDTAPITFVSNDVSVGLKQHVSLTAGGKTGTTERSYSQVTTTAMQTLTLEDQDNFEGALMYATFSINAFEYQSTEEVDPVDMWILLAATGGVLVLARALFALFFVPSRKPGVGKVWRFSRQRKRRRSKLDFRQEPPMVAGSPMA